MLVNSINRFNVKIELITYKNVKEMTTVWDKWKKVNVM
jgi:hypothetical protein